MAFSRFPSLRTLFLSLFCSALLPFGCLDTAGGIGIGGIGRCAEAAFQSRWSITAAFVERVDACSSFDSLLCVLRRTF